MTRKKHTIKIILLFGLIFIVAIVDWLAPQSPVASLSEGIMEATKVIAAGFMMIFAFARR